MILCDVNVLVNAAVAASPHHRVCLDALRQAVGRGEVFGANATIKAGMVRICSHAKIFQPPMAPEQAFAFLTHLDLAGRVRSIEPGPRHWPLFRQFVSDFRLSGAGVMDAWFAALAIEHDATWWTCDGGFAKYPGLDWRNLLVG
ncbi:MAG: PIN domain-containing protein [Planctomycetes bacterium]|nr:PIN domain-containing protein [Planctomycetota bacterium]